MKVRTLFVAAVMFLALSAAAYAQATFSVGSTPVTAVINTGITEMTGDITFTLAPQATATALGTISVYYSGVPVTNPVVSTALNIECTPAAIGVTLNTDNSNLEAGNIIINIPAGLTEGQVIRLHGIRVAVANTGLTSLNAQISSVNNSITAGQTVVQVISSIVNGIVVTGTTQTINAVTGGVVLGSDDATISVKEGFLNAFGAVDVALDPGSLGLRIKVNGVPDNMTLSFPGILYVDEGETISFETTDADGAVLGTACELPGADGELECYYRLTPNDSDPYLIETLLIPVTVTVDGTLVGADPVVAAVSLYQIGTVTTPDTLPIPRYAELDTEVTLVDYTGSNTWLCVPFAQVQPTVSFDTGLGIANTTLDPGDNAIAQPGTIEFHFYPSDGSDPFSYTTKAGSPGTGIDANGKIPAGSTYAVLVSELLAAARATNADVPTAFTGYIFAICNFTNAHGIYTVSNFTTFSQGGQILVTDRNGDGSENWNN